MSNIILYSYWRSSCSYRVRIALNVKNLEYTYQEVHLLRDGGEQRKDNYKMLNPMGVVPCILSEGRNIAESMAIVEYLDAVYPEHKLFPENPYAAARVRQMCEIINAGTQPIQNLGVLQELKHRFGADQELVNEWCRHWISRGLEAFSKVADQVAGTFCFGDSVTAADIFLIPQVYNARRFNVDMEGAFPALARIDETCRALPAFQKADPAVQPDAPAC